MLGKLKLNAEWILAAIFGGMFSILMILLLHTGHYILGAVCLLVIALTLIVINEKSYWIVSAVFLVGGLSEVFAFGNSAFGTIFIILALVAFFLPKFE